MGVVDSVTLTRAEYEDLVDARDHALAMRSILAGAVETLAGDEVDAYLAAPSPLAFWRDHRGLTQTALAERVGLSPDTLAGAELGRLDLPAETYAKIAKILKTRIEDLLQESA